MDDCDSSSDEENDVTTMDTSPHFGDKRAGQFRGGKGKQKKGKTKEDYESNMSAFASTLVTRLNKGVNSKQSRQSGPREELLC